MSSSTSSSSARNELRGFVGRAAAFGLVLVLVNAVADRSFKRLLGDISILGQLERHAASTPRPIRYLVLGDSHTRRAVIEATMPPGTLNLATDGESYLVTEARLEQILLQGPIDTVLFQVDYHSFTRAKREFPADWYWAPRVSYLRLARSTGDWGFVGRLIKGRFASFVGERDLISRAVRLRLSPATDGTPGLPPPPRRFAGARNPLRRHFASGDPLDEVLLGAFERSVRAVLAGGRSVVLVRYPVREDYLEGVPPEARISLADLSSRFDGPAGSVLTIDGSDLYSGVPVYFYDADHLNTQGAQAFSAWLRSQLEFDANARRKIPNPGN